MIGELLHQWTFRSLFEWTIGKHWQMKDPFQLVIFSGLQSVVVRLSRSFSTHRIQRENTVKITHHLNFLHCWRRFLFWMKDDHQFSAHMAQLITDQLGQKEIRAKIIAQPLFNWLISKTDRRSQPLCSGRCQRTGQWEETINRAERRLPVSDINEQCRDNQQHSDRLFLS